MNDPLNPDSTGVPIRTGLSRAEASRINGAKSRGPVTEGGKSVSSQNRVRHGLLARTIVLDGESQRRFSTLLKRLRTQLHPEGPVEANLVNVMAACCWRRMRLWSMENAAISWEVAECDGAHRAMGISHAPTRVALAYRNITNSSRSLDLLSRYEGRLDAQYDRAHRRLEQLRAANEKGKYAYEPRKLVNPLDISK